MIPPTPSRAGSSVRPASPASGATGGPAGSGGSRASTSTPTTAARGSSAPVHAHPRAGPADPDVIGLRLYVEVSNEPAQRVYRSLGMKPGGYDVYEDLWGISVRRSALSRVRGSGCPAVEQSAAEPSSITRAAARPLARGRRPPRRPAATPRRWPGPYRGPGRLAGQQVADRLRALGRPGDPELLGVDRRQAEVARRPGPGLTSPPRPSGPESRRRGSPRRGHRSR